MTPATGPIDDAAHRGHLHALDGMRGLAALAVMIGHSAYVYSDSVVTHGLAKAALLGLLRAGHPSVVLFYALSGFVLYVAYRSRRTGYGPYLIRRVFRIYPALLLALALAAAFVLAAPRTAEAGLGAWTTAMGTYPLDWEIFLRNVLLVGVRPTDNAVDPVIWSLAIEMRFSLLFPLLAWLCSRNRWTMAALAVAAYACAHVAVDRIGLRAPYMNGQTPGGAVIVLLYYLPCFCAGIFAADLFVAQRTPPSLGAVGQVVACAVLIVVAKLLNDDFAWAVLMSLVMLIVLRPGPVAAFLRSAVCLYLGRVSYSLYLIHFPILIAVVYALHDSIGLAAAVLLAPVLALAAATVMYRWVELPGMAAGKRVAALLNRPSRR